MLKVRAGVMPPAGMPRPDRATLDGLVGWLESQLDLAAAARPEPRAHRAAPPAQSHRVPQRRPRSPRPRPRRVAAAAAGRFELRLRQHRRRAEAVADADGAVSLGGAQKVSRLAVGSAGPSGNIDYFRVADDLSQDRHVDRHAARHARRHPRELRVSDGRRVRVPAAAGARPQRERAALPRRSGARGERRRRPRRRVHAARRRPRRSERRRRRAPAPPAASPGPAAAPQRPAISQIATGVRGSAPRSARRATAPTRAWNLRVPVKAGQREVVVTFLNRTAALDETPRLPFLRPYPVGREHSRDPARRAPAQRRDRGPARPTVAADGGSAGAGDERLFVVPAAGGRRGAPARGASSRRWRRAPTAVRRARPTSSRCWRSIARGARAATFERGIERALRRLLVSPEFLFRVERDPAGVAPGAPYRISDLELASRLSFFLWSSIPDDELIALAVAPAARHARPCSSSRCGGCWPARRRPRSSATSPASGCSSATSTPARRCRASSPTSTTRCARASGARPSSSSRASCAKTAARSTCCAPTTRS